MNEPRSLITQFSSSFGQRDLATATWRG